MRGEYNGGPHTSTGRMSIWHRPYTLEELQQQSCNSMDGHLGIRFTEIGPDFVRATMPVDRRTQQPFGLLHGGASVVLAETLGSVGANLCLDPEGFFAVGQEINANHLRGVRSGRVTGTARPIFLGARSQVWEIRIEDEKGRLTCISRLTMAVVQGTPPTLGAGAQA